MSRRRIAWLAAMSLPDKLAPSNTEAEQAVLGALLIDAGAIVRAAGTLEARDFFRPAHARIFEAIMGLFARHEAVDYVTVVAELERANALDECGGAVYITELIERTPAAPHVEFYAGLVSRTGVRRRLIDAAGRIAQIAYDDAADTIEETVDQAESVLFQVLDGRERRDLVPISILIERYYERIEEIQANRELSLGTRTGFGALDRKLGGLQPSDLCIVAGRPGMGKTSWLTSVAGSVADQGATVAFFSLEMSGEQMVQRLLASRTGISSQALRLGQINAKEMELVTRAMGDLSEAPIYIDDTPGLTPFDLRTKVRRLHAERRVDLVIVDYLQLMHGGARSENRVQEISLISRSLKGLAREVRVPIIAASQLSRAVETRADKKPQLSDLRESGSIEQDADIVIFISRKIGDEGPNKNLADIIVAKHRHGPTGDVKMMFIPHETRFVDLPDQDTPEAEVTL
jgi:replicative DNA helicase